MVWDSGIAVFSNTAGIVTVDGTQSAAGLTFNSSFYELRGGTIALTGGAISGTGSGTTISSALSGSTGLSFSGGGSRSISGNNTGLTGLIDVADGVVRVRNNNALGSSSANADRVQLQGGTVLQLDGGIALPKAITTTGANTIQAIGNSSIAGALSFGGNTFFQLDTGAELTLGGSAGLGTTGSSLLTIGSGRLILDAAGAGATAYGFFIRGTDVTVQANAVANPFGVAANINLGDSAGDHTLALNGATIGNNAFLAAAASSRKIENMAAGTSTYAGQVFLGDFTTVLRSTTTSGTLAVSGHLRDDGGTANLEIGNATHTNAGTVLFSKAAGNLYDGSTTIHSGLLVVGNSSGSATGSGPVTVASGGSLGGTGFIGGSTSVSGTVAPGIDGIGKLTVSNNVTWNGGGDYNWQVMGTTNTAGAVAGTTWDLLSVAGTLNLSALTPSSQFNINLWSLASPPTNGNITDFNSANNYEWLAATASNITGFNAAHFAVNVGATNGTGGFSNPLDGGYFGVRQAGGNLYVTYNSAPIPEPGTWAAMAIFAGGAAYAGWRRRRRESV